MAGIFDRIISLAETDYAKAINLAHEHFNLRVGQHGHAGRALVETVAEICRNHPNLVGIAVGILVERLLVVEQHRHQAHLEAEAAHPQPAPPVQDGEAAPGTETLPAPIAPARPPVHAPTHHTRIHKIHPIGVAFEVFGALILLKMGTLVAHLFRRKNRKEIWFAPAAKIRLFSGALAAYNIASAIKSHRISATRNAAIFFFGTDAIKPLLKPQKRR